MDNNKISHIFPICFAGSRFIVFVLLSLKRTGESFERWQGIKWTDSMETNVLLQRINRIYHHLCYGTARTFEWKFSHHSTRQTGTNSFLLLFYNETLFVVYIFELYCEIRKDKNFLVTVLMSVKTLKSQGLRDL